MASARPWMPYAHEPVNPARHARTCAWLRAASRLLRKGLTASSLRASSGYARKGKSGPFWPSPRETGMLIALLAAL
jgi:hypothetical protein